MKKLIALLVAVLSLFSLTGAFASAGIELSKCVTWIYLPVRPTYVADYYKTGDTLIPPDFSTMKETNYRDPEYETDAYYYNFIGWERLNTASEINYYYDNKPGVGFHEKFVQEDLGVVADNDIIFAAVFRLVPKRYDVDFDRNVDVNDIAQMLNVLNGSATSERADIDRDSRISIRDVTTLLLFMEG